MNIYIAHSTHFNYQKLLYKPIIDSQLYKQHHIILPHLDSQDQYQTKSFFDNCDLVIAEISYPSTGMGIELAWADMRQIPIVGIYQNQKNYSQSIEVITNEIVEYEDETDLLKKIELVINSHKTDEIKPLKDTNSD